jgi:nicotinate phosphoribosyltransferase
MKSTCQGGEGKPMKYLASTEEVREGKITDVYFVRSKQVLEAEGIARAVAAEFTVKSLPDGYEFGVFTGLEDVLDVLQGKQVDLWALPEGAVFQVNDPVMVITGDYLEFGALETAILGLICQASGVATKAARLRLAAGPRELYSFGARRMHPVIAPLIDRNAYVGGVDGVAVVASAERLGQSPVGTIPHALVILMGDTLKSVLAFDQHISEDVPRVALVDTFGDEKFESLRVAAALKERLFGVRLDTPANRRGDLLSILEEIRWELDLRGLGHVKLLASGGLDEKEIRRLNPATDAYGVGTSLANAPVLDFAMDLVEVDHKPLAKKGKRSGRKQLVQRGDHRSIVSWEQAGENGLLVQWLRDGAMIRQLEPLSVLKARVAAEVSSFMERYER